MAAKRKSLSALIVLLLAAVFSPNIATANLAAEAKTRVGGLDLSEQTRIEGSTELTPRTHQGISFAYGEIASDYLGAAGGVAQTAEVALPAFTPDEVVGLRQLFGNSVQGAQNLLQQLQSGQTVELPAGVTTQTLQSYQQVAQSAINNGIDTLGVQAMRNAAINLILGGN
jgi:hypothetical protein